MAVRICFKASQEYPSTVIYALLHPSCVGQFLPHLPGVLEAELWRFKVYKEQLDGQKWRFPYEQTSIHSFWEILGVFEPKHEHGSVWTACSKCTLTWRESFGQLNKQAEKPFVLEYFCNCHQDDFTNIQGITFLTCKWSDSHYFTQVWGSCRFQEFMCQGLPALLFILLSLPFILIGGFCGFV